MDDELHDLTPGAGHGLPDDDPAVRAFRSALGGGSRRAGDPRAVLAGIERRARRQHRRRLAGTTTLAVAALAVVVAVSPSVLGAGRTTDTAGPVPSLGQPSTTGPGTGLMTPVPAPALTAESLLRREDVTALGGGAVAAAVVAPPATTTALSAGVCVDEAIAADQPAGAWGTSFESEDAALVNTTVIEGVDEKVLRWDAQAGADAFRLQVQAAGDRCVADGTSSEGTGPYAQLDASAITPEGGTALLYAADGGNGGQQVVAVMTSGGTAVVLLATLSGDDARAAADLLAPTAVVAAQRAFADSSDPIATDGGSTAPATAPAVTADSLVRPEDVTFLGEGVALDGDAVLATGEVPAAGVCIDTADGVSPTSSSVQGTFTAGAAEGGDQEVLLERVLRWDAQSEADSYLLAVAAQAATCSPTEVGLEGTGPWTAQDATAITPEGGQAQVWTAPFGGFTDVQVLVASGNTVVKLQALVAEADPVLAVEQLTDAATAAGERAFADASAPAGGPAPEDGPTDDSLAAS